MDMDIDWIVKLQIELYSVDSSRKGMALPSMCAHYITALCMQCLLKPGMFVKCLWGEHLFSYLYL